MKITIDESGQIKLPEELLKELKIKKGGTVAIDTDYFGDKIIIKKIYPGCLFCNCGIDLININHKHICIHCIKILKNAKTGDSFHVVEAH